MMRKTVALSFVAVFAGFSGSGLPAWADGDVNVYTYRQPDLIQPLFDAFTKETGITVNVLYLDTGLIERMKTEGENSPADVILTTDIGRLNDLKREGVTAQLADSKIDAAIPAKFRDPQGQWFGLGMDARVVYAARDRVKDTAITYEALADARWKGKLCLRDGQHASNLGLFADMIAAHGADVAAEWLKGLKANLAQRPSGNDAGQVQAIAEGKCDLALGSATTLAGMLSSGSAPEDRKSAEAIRVILPGTEDRGAYANISGMALGRYAPNRDNAVALMRYMVTKEAQQLYAGETLEYPVVAGAEPGEIIKRFGTLKPDAVPLSDVIEYRDKASELVETTGFNDGPAK